MTAVVGTGPRYANWTLAALAIALAMAAFWPARSSLAQEISVQEGSTLSKQAIEDIVRDYILSNPEIVIEALQTYQAKRDAAELQAKVDAIATFREDLINDPASPFVGNPEGDVVMVEFFDYRCPYCRRVAGVLEQALEEDPGVKLIFKEFPILGEQSIQGARAALAAEKQGKYKAFHFALMEKPGDMSRAHIMATAEQAGLDTTRLAVDMESKDIDDALRRNYELAERLGINGTPALVVGETLVPGAFDKEALLRIIAEARAGAG